MHEAVMVNEVLDNLILDNQGHYLDCTYGMGGHSKAMLNKLSLKGCLHVMDRDPYSTQLAQKLADRDKRVNVIKDSFSNIHNYFKTTSINGVLFDLGISSYQLDTSHRGFSFQSEGPLDMRMDQSQGLSASEWINVANEKEITEVLWTLGEERHSRRIAKAICKRRVRKSIDNTRELADLIVDSVPRISKRHPATNSFRAIRMFINQELEELREGLEEVASILLPGARMAIISFHSIEDRVAKRFIQGKDRRRSEIKFKLISGKPFMPELSEVKKNPRSRSAVLRIAERLM